MTITYSPTGSEDLTTGALHARAICGDAHGTRWIIPDVAQPPGTVDLPVLGAKTAYRLVRERSTGRPVRDHEGSFMYLPVAQGVAAGGAHV